VLPGERSKAAPGPTPAKLTLGVCRLRTWPPHQARAKCHRARVIPGPNPAQGLGGGCYETCGGPGPSPGKGAGLGVARHVAALGLALVKWATPTVVDLIFALGLSQYLGVPIPRGTDR
jgi:hypothetical protein